MIGIAHDATRSYSPILLGLAGATVVLGTIGTFALRTPRGGRARAARAQTSDVPPVPPVPRLADADVGGAGMEAEAEARARAQLPQRAAGDEAAGPAPKIVEVALSRV